MKELNKEKGIRLYDFEYNYSIGYVHYMNSDRKIIFRGTKTELFEKEESFWKGITEPKTFLNGKYKILGSTFKRFTALESGHSAISDCKEYVLITEEKP